MTGLRTQDSILMFLCLLFASAVALPLLAQNRPDVQLALVDRTGRRTPVAALPGTVFAPRISPDGKELVFDTADNGQLWIAPLANMPARRQLGRGSNRGPMWTGDGKRILYITDDQGAEALFVRAADGSGVSEKLTQPARAPESWSPRDPQLSFIRLNPGGDYDVWTYSFASKQAVPFVAIPGTPQHSSRFSPDGRWIAYVSGETGRLEVYVRPFPAGTPVVQVSSEGGGHPLWSPDQKELFFDNNGRMYAVAIKTGPPFTADKPVELPISGFIQGPLRRQYDLMPDGKNFLMLFPTAQ